MTLTDVLAPLGIGLYGTLEVSADSAVSAFARVHAQAAAGGTYGYGVAGRPPGDAIPPTLRGVFVSASEPADVATNDLLLVNPGDAAVNGRRQPLERRRHRRRNGDVRRRAARDANPFPRSGRRSPGDPAALGRLDVAPDGPLFATLVRKDVASGDADPLTPVTATR